MAMQTRMGKAQQTKLFRARLKVRQAKAELAKTQAAIAGAQRRARQKPTGPVVDITFSRTKIGRVRFEAKAPDGEITLSQSYASRQGARRAAMRQHRGQRLRFASEPKRLVTVAA